MTLKVLREAVQANLLDDIELFEIQNHYIVARIKSKELVHGFRIHESENVTAIIFNYMDAIESFEAAMAIEQLWNRLAFDFSVITRFINNHNNGLQIFADFRHSPLLSSVLWEEALRESGLYLVEDLGSVSEGIRNIVVQKDPILS